MKSWASCEIETGLNLSYFLKSCLNLAAHNINQKFKLSAYQFSVLKLSVFYRNFIAVVSYHSDTQHIVANLNRAADGTTHNQTQAQTSIAVQLVMMDFVKNVDTPIFGKLACSIVLSQSL